MMRAMCLAVLCLAGLGCKDDRPSLEERAEARRVEFARIVEAHRTAATPALEAIRSIAGAAESLPPVTALEPAAGGLELETVLLQDQVGLRAGVQAETTEKKTVVLKPEIDPVRLDTLERALSEPGFDEDLDYDLERHFVRLEALKYLAIVRVHEYTPPTLVTSGADRRFETGRALGDVLVYAIDDARRVGAFPFEVLSNDTISVESTTDIDIQRELEDAFPGTLRISVEAELKAFAAGKAGSAGPGVAQTRDWERFARDIRLGLFEDHMGAFVQSVEIVPGTGDLPKVIIHAGNPHVLTSRDGTVDPQVAAKVHEVLGRTVEIDVRANARPSG